MSERRTDLSLTPEEALSGGEALKVLLESRSEA